MSESSDRLALVADIGGTNVRLGLAFLADGQIHVDYIQRYRCAGEHATMADP